MNLSAGCGEDIWAAGGLRNSLGSGDGLNAAADTILISDFRLETQNRIHIRSSFTLSQPADPIP
jgi:hypothetical protein